MAKPYGEGRRMIERGLDDVVLSWSLEDILNDQLFASKINPIASTFHSLEVYLASYIPPLLEETRWELSSCLEAISCAPSYQIQRIRAVHKCEIYDVDIKFASNEPCSTSDYKPQKGDLFFLSNIKPLTVNEIMRHGVIFSLVMVLDVKEYDAYLRRFKVKASKYLDTQKDFLGYGNAIYLTNISSNARIWTALHIKSELNNNFSIIRSVLQPKCLADVTCNICYSLKRNSLFSEVPEEKICMDLNESQLEAVKSAVLTVSCRHSQNVELIWGPPGTGKTKTVCAILWTFLYMKCRILVCAPTNVAVVGVCSCLISLLNKSQVNNHALDFPVSLGDIVLFGNRDKMKIDDEFRVVFLEHRVEQLLSCFSSNSGLKHRIAKLVSFFEDCAIQYESYLKTTKATDDTNCFLGFIRNGLNEVLSPLEDCVKKLCIHLPGKSLSKEDAKILRDAISLFGTLHDLIIKGCSSEVDIINTFRRDNKNTENLLVPTEIGAYRIGMSDMTKLEKTKKNLLILLDALKGIIKVPCGVDETWIKKFCLRGASLIFCTASSSISLHSVEMDPLDILVVDEASQLKESEIIIPLRLNGLKHAILAGDEVQLQAMVKSQVSESVGFGRSLFERLVSLGCSKHLLNIQYRMHPSISLFPNIKFYGKRILDGPNVQDFNYGKYYSDLLFGPYAFIDITDGREESEKIGGGHKNMTEVAVVQFLIENIFKSWKANGGKLSIGVIAPYRSQVKAIMDKLGKIYDMDTGFDVKISSIDGFQGEEVDFVILSTVRCNKKGFIGFLSDTRRMNVALTRPRHHLWILGNAETLLRSGTAWEELVRDAKNCKCFFNAYDKNGLPKLILNVKCQLDQMEDLFKPNSVLNCAIWKVVFNDDLKKSFQKLNSFESKKEAIQTIMYLAEGWRSKKRSVGLSDSFQLTRIYRVKELFLVWSVDIMKDGNYVQVIKVWDILSSSLLMKMISRLDRIFFKYTETFISCCKVICTECSLVRGSIKVPKRWNTEQVILRYKKNVKQEDGPVNNDVLVKSEVSESFFLTKFYASSSGIASHLLTGNDGTELNIPFELTDEEKDAVRFPRSSLILGTSGNRTKLLTTKLVQKQQQNSISLQGVSLSEGCDPKAAFENRLKFEKEDLLKQMFITSSSKLCLATKDHICRLSRFAADGCLYGPPSDIDMQEKDNELSQFMDIPDNFNGLSNEHYPLVITIDKFLMMLDGSVSCSFFRRFQNAICFSSNRSSLSKPFAMEIFIHKQVTYEKFLGSYWPHFNTHLKRKLDASIVYTEIISHIKGSLDGNMGREEYVMLSIKHISPFCKETRKNIYDIFLCYEKKKLLRAEFDISDFVIDLHRRLRCEAYLSAKFDYVYVDEVQDLTMRQINLLKYVCTNYDEGFTFAGDPTPSIASAINFSFGDIPSLLYKKFKSELITENQKIKLDRYHNEDIFHLNQNRRTHSGILKLAKNILNLLYTVLPLSVDKIAETSINSAKSPILFESYTSDDAAISCMYQIEFGAEQVILVRDDLVKRKVIELIGSKALVLTILECKDIEFQDVLLYDFFEQSPIANNWRVVLEHLNKDGLVKLDQSKHNLYCCELTQLYVAITRAKQRLWICDNSSNYGKPMFDYWKSLCLVRVKYLDSSFVKAMGTVSTKDDWKLRGIELFNAQNFEMATLCFEKAGDTYREKWARAAGLVCTGDRLISSKPEMAKSFLKKAASIYESIGKVESAIACCMKI